MDPYILSIGVAVPKYQASQADIFDKIAEVNNVKPSKRPRYKSIFENTTINKRHTVLEESVQNSAIEHLLSSAQSDKGLSVSSRNEIYIDKAPKLCLAAAKKAIDHWQGHTSQITHVISISCTGMVAPGLELHLQKSLKLPASVDRLAINYMGCFGAFKGISTARAIAQSDPTARILVVCTELCSLHIQSSMELKSVIPNALFADGAAAIIVGAKPAPSESPLWKIKQNHCLVIPDSTELMTWKISNNGFLMSLSKKVPHYIKEHTQAFVETLIANHDANLSDCEWPIHPGGRAIVEAIASVLNIKDDQLDSSLSILRDYGNMSSATFLFVLEHMLQSKNPKQWSIGLGFGPGLSIEGVLLENCYAKA